MQDLKTKLTNRSLKFDESQIKDELICILINDDNKPTDWAQIYSRVLYHTGMSYEEVSRRTIPQIMAILDGAEENISIKMGIPDMNSTSPLPPSGLADEVPSISQFASFANAFTGI